MGDLTLKSPWDHLFKRSDPLCNFLSPNNAMCKRRKLVTITTTNPSSYQTVPDVKIKIDTKGYPLLAALMSAPKPKQPHWGWLLVIQFSKLIKAMDIDIRNMAMNGRRAGCHCREAQPIPKGRTRRAVTQCFYNPRGPNPKGCNTHYKAGTEANAHLEVRPVAGKNISRVYRFWVHYTKPLKHMFKGVIPVTTHGFYGKIGPNWNNRGPMCYKSHLGFFDDALKRCRSYERYFRVPFHGSIPQNWVAKYGHLAYSLDYPFNLRNKTFTNGFLGVWGMVDHATYRRMGVPYMSFPTRIDHIFELLSTIDMSRASHVNRNKPYKVTGMKPHIEWLDLHNTSIKILLKDGTITVPGIGKIVFNRAKYLKEANLDRHPRLLAIAREWRQYRKGGPKADPTKAKQLAIEYYRQRTIISKNVNRIDVKFTARNIIATIHNPAINNLNLPLKSLGLNAEGLSIGKIRIVAPPATALFSGRVKLSDLKIEIEGLSATKLVITDRRKGMQFAANDCRVGRIIFDKGRLGVTHLDATSWKARMLGNGFSVGGGYTLIENITAHLMGPNRGFKVGSIRNASLEIASRLFGLKITNSSMKGLNLLAGRRGNSFSIRNFSTDIHTGRIGVVKFGKLNVGQGRIGRGTLRQAFLKVVSQNGRVKADIGGRLDVAIFQTIGSKLGLNIPGLSLSGKLTNIHVKGPAHFTLTPNSWRLSRKLNGSAENLSVGARMTNAFLIHNPTRSDAGVRKLAHSKAIRTNMKFTSADFRINNIREIAFRVARRPNEKSRFTRLNVSGVSITKINGSGKVSAKVPLFGYLEAIFTKLIGYIRVASVKVKANGGAPSSEFSGIDIKLQDTDRRRPKKVRHRCSIKGSVKFSPNNYHLGTKINCLFRSPGRGYGVIFESVKRNLKARKVYR